MFESAVSKEQLEQMQFLDGGNGEYLSNHVCDGNRGVATPQSVGHSPAQPWMKKTGRNQQPRKFTREINPAPYRRVELHTSKVHDDSPPRVTQIDVRKHKPSASVVISASARPSASVVISASARPSASVVVYQDSASVDPADSVVISASARPSASVVVKSRPQSQPLPQQNGLYSNFVDDENTKKKR